MQLPSLNWLSLLAILAITTGCGTAQPVLVITPTRTTEKLSQTFSKAYTTRDPAGDYQIVLLSDSTDDANNEDPGAVLIPIRSAAIRQILQIRVLWRPSSGVRSDTAVATNAALHWYVLGETTGDGTNLIHYAGTGFVSVVPNGPGQEVTIRNGQVRPVERHGELVDPLGAFQIDGKFDAVASDARVRQVMADVQAATADANTTKGPPPRVQTGP